MINPFDFMKACTKYGINFITGVPDSLLKNLTAVFDSSPDLIAHQISSNEGSAVGLAIGRYLATGRVPIVYMQNSGLGNSINPLTSIAAKEIYSIPLILLIGWRGEILPNGNQIEDEPQHKFQGKITTKLLNSLEIPFIILDFDSDIEKTIEKIMKNALHDKSPQALLIRSGTFSKTNSIFEYENQFVIKREDAISMLLDTYPKNSFYIATTGFTGRILMKMRLLRNEKQENDFLVIGGMGIANQIATGISDALKSEKARIICLDGDGSALMHLGGLLNSSKSERLVHVLLNNGCHESVGKQETSAGNIDFSGIAGFLGYKNIYSASTLSEMQKAISSSANLTGSTFIEIKCRVGNNTDLPRPKDSPVNLRRKFEDTLRKNNLEIVK